MKTIVKIFALVSLLVVAKITRAQCDFYGSITVSTSSFENGAGFTQEYVLVHDRDNVILAYNTSGTFNSVTPGEYRVYAINYFGSRPSVISMGALWSDVTTFDANTANCFDATAAYNGGVITVCELICTNNPITVSTSLFHTGGSFSQSYVLLPNSLGTILSSNLSGNFNSSEHSGDGIYRLYAVNTESSSVLSSIESGDNWATALTNIASTCSEFIGPYFVEVNGTACPLGIGETQLYGEPKEQSNALQWTLQTSEELDHISIMRSADNQSFRVIGTSTSLDFEDKTPETRSFYKLKLHFKNGYVGYSNIININREKVFSILSLYPNPSQGKLHLNVQSGEEELYVTIQNALGQQMMSKQFSVNPGISVIDLDISSLAEAMYYVRVSNGSETQLNKINKID